MTRDRNMHLSALLPSGQVLVAGGISEVTPSLAPAELFDPAAERWSQATGMLRPSDSATATVLTDGRVLIAGGRTRGRQYLSAAEIYEPGSGRWVPTGSLSAARSLHTATLLPNGEVLVAGGGTGSNAGLASSELFNPGAGGWSATGNMRQGRFWHTATLLRDGTVLAAGGLGGGLPLATAERYLPASGSWEPVDSLAIPRVSHTATLLADGRVLVAGGTVVQGSSAAPTATAEIFDPASGTWSGTSNMSTARASHTATLLPSGRVLVVGGEGSEGTAFVSLASAEIYDPESGRWVQATPIREARLGHTANLLPDGRVLVVGGVTQRRTTTVAGTPGAASTLHLPSADLFDPGE
jgi:hypothetical protein